MPGDGRYVVGITGSSGLIGWHLRSFLHKEPRVDVIPCSRDQFWNDAFLEELVPRCDAVVHLAGMNRGEDGDVANVNLSLAQRLVEFLDRSRSRPTVVYSSSTHINRDSPYGRSKLRAGQILESWAERAGARCVVLVLPHVYGEGGRPFYNSVVSTFCHQLACREEPEIHVDGELELLHAQDVSRTVFEAIVGRESGVRRISGSPLSVSELLERLRSLAKQYEELVIPKLDSPLDLRLFNTYRSYLFPANYPVAYRERRDHRGTLFECVRSRHGGQCFVSSTHPGVTRGNHFHLRKFERFAVISGDAVIRLRRLFDETVHEFAVRSAEPVFIDMPTLHTHSIENTGDGELMTLFWSHEFFDPADADTFLEPVLR